MKKAKTRIIFMDQTRGKGYIDVLSSYIMTERFYLDRDQDMVVKLENGTRVRLKKSLIALIEELPDQNTFSHSLDFVDQSIEETPDHHV